MSRTLFDIGNDLHALNTLCEETEDQENRDELCDARLAVWFDELKSDESAKLESYRLYIAQLESEAAAAKAEAEQFQKMARVREARADWLKRSVKEYTERTNREKIVTNTNRVFAIQKNGGVLPVFMGDVRPEEMPTQFQKVTVSFNTDAIRKALMDDEYVPFASLGERGTHLRIK